MIHLGVDFGEKRVGVAVSDEKETLAFPLKVLSNKNLLENLKKIAGEKKATTFVLGESKNYKGEDNQIMNEINKLKENLQKEGYKVFLEPEFMSSRQAAHLQGENQMIDASAAAIILQSFLDKRKNKVI